MTYYDRVAKQRIKSPLMKKYKEFWRLQDRLARLTHRLIDSGKATPDDIWYLKMVNNNIISTAKNMVNIAYRAEKR